MTIQIALLRGINVGGHRKVAMSDLRELVAGMGFEDAKTLLQTGNLIFRSQNVTGTALEKRLEAEATKWLDLDTDFLVRTADEWDRIVRRNPFPEEAVRDPAHLVVMVLKVPPSKAAAQALSAVITGPESVRVDGRQAYITYPAGIGRSRLTSALLERRLATRGTARNWNTVLKLAALTRG